MGSERWETEGCDERMSGDLKGGKEKPCRTDRATRGQDPGGCEVPSTGLWEVEGWVCEALDMEK